MAEDHSNPLARYKDLTPIQSTRDQNSGNVSGVLKHGYISVKEEGLKAFLWTKRYMTLRELTLSFHRNEVSCSFFLISVTFISPSVCPRSLE